MTENSQPVKLTPLRSVKMINRMLYLDNDPSLNHLLPLCNEYTVGELATEICRACATYDMVVTWEAAKFLAQSLLRNADRNGEMRHD